MYEIIKNGEVIEIQEKLNWVRYQKKNNMMVSCDEKDGQCILGGAYHIKEETGEIMWKPNSVIYNVVCKPFVMGYETVEVREIKWLPISQQQRADIDYIAIMTEVDL